MEEQDSFKHALGVLEYDRIREVVSSYATSILGRKLALGMRPFEDVERLRVALAETSELRELLRDDRMPLQGLSDVAGDLRSLVKNSRPAEPEFLYRIVDILRIGLSVRTLLTKDAERYPTLSLLGGGLHDLPELRETIVESVDPRDGVRDSASPRLAELRRESKDLRDTLRRRVQGLLHRNDLRKCFQAEGVALQHDRYLMPVKAEYRSLVSGPIRGRSQKGSTLYIEPQEVVFEGDRLVDLLEKARQEETRILWDITKQVLDARRFFEKLQSRLARVDFTFAKSAYATAFELEVAEIDDHGQLELRDARHPYLMWLARDTRKDIHRPDLESIRNSVVPLDMRLGGESPLLIVTGPNTGGKTVALKTVGLCVLMAMSGLPIPAAEGARVPLYTSVFADIGDEQSIEQSLSTFSSHLKQIGEVIAHATERSLILLDELGSGTDPIEGAALGRSILDHFRERSWSGIITTHLGSLKQYAFLHDGVENAAMEFNQKTLTPTYRLLLGVPGNSNALAIARRHGIPEAIVDSAAKEVDELEEPTRDLISKMEKTRRRIEKERRRTERVRKSAQVDKREYEQRLEDVDARKEALDREADLVVEDTVRSVREVLRPIVARLKSVPQSHKPTVEELEQRVDELLVGTPLGEKREAFARSLKKEHVVWVPRFRAKGTVRKINKGERRLTVLINGVATELSFDDISWIDTEDS